jgi:hypothetical protein
MRLSLRKSSSSLASAKLELDQNLKSLLIDHMNMINTLLRNSTLAHDFVQDIAQLIVLYSYRIGSDFSRRDCLEKVCRNKNCRCMRKC